MCAAEVRTICKGRSREGLAAHTALVVEVVREDVHGERRHAGVSLSTHVAAARIARVQPPMEEVAYCFLLSKQVYRIFSESSIVCILALPPLTKKGSYVYAIVLSSPGENVLLQFPSTLFAKCDSAGEFGLTCIVIVVEEE